MLCVRIMVLSGWQSVFFISHGSDWLHTLRMQQHAHPWLCVATYVAVHVLGRELETSVVGRYIISSCTHQRVHFHSSLGAVHAGVRHLC